MTCEPVFRTLPVTLLHMASRALDWNVCRAVDFAVKDEESLYDLARRVTEIVSGAIEDRGYLDPAFLKSIKRQLRYLQPGDKIIGWCSRALVRGFKGFTYP